MEENIFSVLQQFLDHFDFGDLINKTVSVVLTILVFLIILKILKHIINRIFNQKGKLSIENIQGRKRTLTLRKTVMSFTTWTVWLVCLLVILSYFIDIGALLAVAGVGTIAIGFAAQSIVEDVMSGLMIIIEDQFNVGDYVKIDDHYGTVEKISVRTTAIRQIDGGLYYIYNGQITQSINYSKGKMIAPVDIVIGYNEDVKKVESLLQAACEKIQKQYPELFAEVPSVIGVIAMDSISLTIRISASVAASEKAKAQSLLWTNMNGLLEKEKIQMPYNKIEIFDAGETQLKVYQSSEKNYGKSQTN